MPKLKHKSAKLFRKVRVSGSVDKDAYNILVRIAQIEKRNLSNALNLILYEAGSKRGMYTLPDERESQPTLEKQPWEKP